MVLQTVNAVFQEFSSRAITVIPNLLAALVFGAAAYLGIKFARKTVETTLSQKYEDILIINLIGTLTSVFLWFASLLVFLNILGLGAIAASLGTATGFLALGVAYAVSEMMADSVAGYYLIRDPDFEVGHLVKTRDMNGEVIEVGLRKSRLELENGDIAVLSNSEIEKKRVRELE